MGLLELKNVTLHLGGQKILNDLSIDFWEGHVHAVVGPNGAGKSTMAATIMGLAGYTDIEGDIIFNGKSIKNSSVDERAKHGITLAWQEPARFEGLTVRDFVGTAMHGKQTDDLESLLEEVGLDPVKYINRVVDRTLSGGERKKVELASILAMEPKIALLDEPDSGIDVESLERIFDAVRLLKDRQTTVILITHSLAVLKQAEHAFLICSGQLVEKGPVEKLQKYFEDKCIPCDHKNEPQLAATGGGT